MAISLITQGSYAYGTNNENSNIDFRGVTLQLPSDLIGLTEFDQYEDDKTDTVIFGFNKLIKLLRIIKTAILQSQYEAAKSVNEKQLMLYYGIGKYISYNSREGFWGKGAIDSISEQLNRELPGLRGFSARNLRYMRMFYEEWCELEPLNQVGQMEQSDNLALISAKTSVDEVGEIWHLQMPNCESFPEKAFFEIGFTQHRTIFEKVKDKKER